MVSDDKLAAATIAQIFGSELFRAQQNARTDSGSVPDIVKIDPKQFLVSKQRQIQNNQAEQQRMLQALQREAEMSCPLPQEQSQQPIQQTGNTEVPIQATFVAPNPVVVNNQNELVTSGSLEQIVIQLTRIADCLEASSNNEN